MHPEHERLVAFATSQIADTARVPMHATGDPVGRSPLQDCMVFDTIPITPSDPGLRTAILDMEATQKIRHHQAFMKALASKGDSATRPNNRPRKEARGNRKRYKKAHRYYGKTYIVTQLQLWAGLAVFIGSVLALSGLLFSAYVWMLEQASLIQ